MIKCCCTKVLNIIQQNYLQKEEMYDNKYIYKLTDHLIKSLTIKKIHKTDYYVTEHQRITQTSLFKWKKIFLMDEVLENIFWSMLNTNILNLNSTILDTLKSYQNSFNLI